MKTIQEKINDLKSRLFEQKLQDHERINRIGWGYGMRCVKMPKFTKADQLESRIEELENKLKP